MTEGLAEVRRTYAEAICTRIGVTDPHIRDAFAAVPREDFLPPPPWIMSGVATGGGMGASVDHDPRQVYRNVVIALDPAHGINNGEPALHAHMMAELGVAPGKTIIQVGSGLGYYTAILSHIVGDQGRVYALEIMDEMFTGAAQRLKDLPNVTMVHSDASTLPAREIDGLYINAGASRIEPQWIRALGPEGVMVMPLTVDPASLAARGYGSFSGLSRRWGAMLVVNHQGDRYAARLSDPVAFIGCVGHRDPKSELRLAQAVQAGRMTKLRSLKLGPVSDRKACVLEGDGWWLSSEPV